MPKDISNKYGRIFLCLIISGNFPDKEAHKDIIYNYIMELKVTKSNSMESYRWDILDTRNSTKTSGAQNERNSWTQLSKNTIKSTSPPSKPYWAQRSSRALRDITTIIGSWIWSNGQSTPDKISSLVSYGLETKLQTLKNSWSCPCTRQAADGIIIRALGQ
jgi:hypothetical protein